MAKKQRVVVVAIVVYLGLSGAFAWAFHRVGMFSLPWQQASEPPTPPPTPVEPIDHFRVAVNHAMSAAEQTQSASTLQDWRGVVGSWEGAIASLKQIAPDDPNHATAQTKIVEYGKNLAYAQQQLATAKPAERSRPVANSQSIESSTQYPPGKRPEDLLAVIDGRPESSAAYAALLNLLEPLCDEDRMLLADMSVKTQQLLAEKGVREKNSDILGAAYQITSVYDSSQRCAETFAVIAIVTE